MNQQELRLLYMKYNRNPGIPDQIEVLDMFANIFLTFINDHQKDEVTTSAEADAKIVLQMMLTKTLSVKKLLEGVSFLTKNGVPLSNIIDPTIIATLVRNIFETTAMFNTIYRVIETKEQAALIHLLWVIAGLKYRQRFTSHIMTTEVKQKQEDEEQTIKELENTIESLELYKGLNSKNQEKIKNRLDRREYLIRFENKEVFFLTWSDVGKSMGMDERLFDKMYTYFSLYAHPSNVSVFQFAEMFHPDSPGYIELTQMNLHYARFFLSIFIADYIHLFPKTKETFEKLPLIDQIILNFSNKMARGNNYTINNAYHELG
jgi:hypothetical protein